LRRLDLLRVHSGVRRTAPSQCAVAIPALPPCRVRVRAPPLTVPRRRTARTRSRRRRGSRQRSGSTSRPRPCSRRRTRTH
jgi:hypothetical protein